ncbi:MAG: rhomboid family intramembrane serine protease [Bacteroidales bacterium]|nr:rhomboid family intramembrane serine protease [Bacteroidales bacterium]
MMSSNLILLIIIIPTALVSFVSFNNSESFNKLKFNPYMIAHHKEWYRFLSHGFVHADWIHLLFNMYVLWEFGKLVVYFFQIKFVDLANLHFLGLYFPALIVSSLWSYFRNKDFAHYNAVGASGAVSAVVFASIVLYPQGRMGLIFIPIMLPSWIFGAIYLAYTVIMARKQTDNIGHDAHLWGAVYGIVYTFVFYPRAFVDFFQYIFI